MNNYPYHLGGCLPINAHSYVKRKADEDLYQGIKAGDFCYVLNSRQMGKSSLRVRTIQRLEAEGFFCTTVDLTEIGTFEITPSEWYAGIIDSIVGSLKLNYIFNIDDWWETYNKLSHVKKFSKFIGDFLLNKVGGKIVIFVDEVDSILTLPFSVDDFFAVIRDFYNRRAEQQKYERITFVMMGVATPSDLIRDKRRTPFNIGRGIELTGFKIDEVEPLTLGLMGKVNDYKAVMSGVLDWTGGQPFLTQKVCRLILELAPDNSQNYSEVDLVENIVRQKIIENWQLYDQPEHLKTISDRLLVNEQTANRLLGLYQQILNKGEIDNDGSAEKSQLQLSGLVVKHGNKLTVYNRIYQEVFNLEWVETELEKLRPYSETITAWFASGCEDESRLLRGQALQDAQIWATNKSLSDKDYKFLAASQKNEFKEEKHRSQLEINKVLLQRLRIAIFSSIAMSILAIFTGIFLIKSLISESKIQLNLLSISSEALFTSDRGLDALITEIKAGKKLKKSLGVGADTRMRVIMALHQGIYLSKERNRLDGHEKTVINVTFNSTGDLIASASDDNTVKLWNTQGKLLQTFKGHNAEVRSISFHPNKKLLASASHDRTIKLWSIDGKLLQTLVRHQHKVRDVSWSQDGKILASASADGSVILWSENGKLLRTLRGHSGWVESVSFSPDSQLLASGATDKTIKVWDLETGELLQTVDNNASVKSLNFSSDGQLLVSATGKAIALWSRQGEKFQLFKKIEGHDGLIQSIGFSPDGQIIASASYDNTVKLWSLNGELLQIFGGHNAPVYSVSFSPSENILASTGADETVILWNLLHTLIHTGQVNSIDFSPDSQILVSGSTDGILKVWHFNGTLLKSLDTHQANVLSVSFSPNSEMLASAGSDGKIILWNLNLDQLLAEACQQVYDYLQTNPNISESDRLICEI